MTKEQSSRGGEISRRGFLRRAAASAAAGVAAPWIVPASALGRGGRPAPSERVTMAFIGTGNQGTNDLRGFLGDARVQVVAVCDCNREGPGYWSGTVRGAEPARRTVDEHYSRRSRSGSHKGCRVTWDHREILARRDIDAVEIATPDHWHAILVVEAARAGKDIFCQKPLSLAIAEGRAMSDAVARYGCVFQCGSQRRSDFNCRRACELVRNGRIGRLHTVRCGLPGGTPDYGRTARFTKPEPVPEGFHYDRWLGPAPWAPFCRGRVGVNFRWVLDYSGGQLTDWGGHHPDVAQWGMGTERTGPVEVRNARGTFADGPLYNTATDYHFECVYANGVRLIISNRQRGGTTFEGTEGWVSADHGRHDAHPKSILTSRIGPDEIHLYKSDHHFRNFIDCVLSRSECAAPVEVAHRSITLAHLGNIALLLGRDLTWDPVAERFGGDGEANRLLDRAYRLPWRR